MELGKQREIAQTVAELEQRKTTPSFTAEKAAPSLTERFALLAVRIEKLPASSVLDSRKIVRVTFPATDEAPAIDARLVAIYSQTTSAALQSVAVDWKRHDSLSYGETGTEKLQAWQVSETDPTVVEPMLTWLEQSVTELEKHFASEALPTDSE